MTENKISLLLLIEGCRKQNPHSQRRLYEHFYGYGMNTALRYSKSRDEALEILNDSFLKVFNHINQFDQNYDFKPWLRRIITNTAIDYYRKMQREPKNINIENIQEPGEPEFEIPEIFPETDLLPIIQSLSPMYRMVFNLYVMEGYKHSEIAEKLNINVSTFKSNLARAKVKLREAFLKKSNRKIITPHI